MSRLLPFRAIGAAIVVVAVAAPGSMVMAVDDATTNQPSEPIQTTTLLDVSGLAPVGPNQALAVHDAKNPDESDAPRASLLTLTDSPSGVSWQPLTFDWPEELGPANDLESASGIPGSSFVILAESGDDGSDYQRLFLVEVDADAADGPAATIAAVTEWPDRAFNVEGMAVADIDGELVLLYAERAQGEAVTEIQSASLSLEPFEIGEPTGVDFDSPAVLSGDDRPVSAMEIGSGGIIRVASAYDPGSDDGPFSGSIWAIGAVIPGDDGPRVEIMPDPQIMAFTDGFKVESLAVLERADGSRALFLGTDDEDYGGVIRPLPAE